MAPRTPISQSISPGAASAPVRMAVGSDAPLPRVHLASRSPRRRELLKQAGIVHEASHPGLDDSDLVPGEVSPEQWVMALAYLKAATAARALPDSAASIVLGADTVVVHRARLIGTPRNAAEARQMLVDMRDAEHEVVTGVALLDRSCGRRDLLVDRASVCVGPITDEQIDEYVGSNQWAGKAGGYNLSERLAAGWPIAYRGDPGTVMGLPILRLVPRLRRFAAA